MKKQNRVKGFTLIELIVVMAVFGVIMFGALQLLTPVGNIFQKSYKTETISAAAQNIGNYLEDALRYADAVQITADTSIVKANGEIDPSAFNTIMASRDGNIYQKSATTGDMAYEAGDIYVLEIDNSAGGTVRRWQYDYVVGDSTCPDDTKDTTATINDNAAYDSGEYVVNLAHYTNYHYNISLGIFTLDNNSSSATYRQLIKDTSYYGSFTDTALQIFGRDNFGLTITAFPYVLNSDGTVKENGQSGTLGSCTYDPAYLYTASVGFTNLKRTSTVHKYNWIDHDKDGNTTAWHVPTDEEFTADKANNYKYIEAEQTKLFNWSGALTDDMHDLKEISKFYIIYIYPGNNIVT